MTVVFHRLAILVLYLLGCYVRAATERYIIYPESWLSLQERQQFTERLNELAGAQGKLYTSFRRQEIRFWCANLTENAYKELLEDSKVLDIHVNKVAINLFTKNESSDRNGTHLFRPTSEMIPSNLSASEENFYYLTQLSPVATELRALSQPVGSGSISHYPNYVYRVGRRPTYIYHVELGINQQHQDFGGREVEWLYTELSKATGADTMTEAAAGGGHSTCAASKAVGNLYGASKSATLVVVKMPDLSEDSLSEVLDTVIDDIDGKNRRGTSVVSISWGTEEIKDTRVAPSTSARTLLTQFTTLMAMKVAFVCAAGNAATEANVHGYPRLYVDTWPASFRRRDPRWIYFVVGNSDINGARDLTSQLALPYDRHQVYAPGVDIKCASSTSSTGYTTWTGTSFSAPLVAGVIADLLSMGELPTYPPFWWKRPGGQSVVWNLVDDAHNPPVFGSGNATLLNYTLPIFSTTTSGNEQLDVSSE